MNKRKVDTEEKAVDSISEAKMPNEVKLRAKDQDKAAEALLKAMAAELRRPVRE